MSFNKEIEQAAKELLQQCRRERAIAENSTEDNLLPKHNIENDPRDRLKNMQFVSDLAEYASLNKYSAMKCFQENKELEGISYLSESHAVYLREQVIHRYSKTKIKEEVLKKDFSSMELTYINFDLSEDTWNGKTLKYRLKSLPEEWYIVQVTTKYKPFSYQVSPFVLPLSDHIRETEAIYISVLPTGQKAADPIVVSLPKPTSNVNYDIMKEIGTVLYYLKSDLKRRYENGEMYWSIRKKQNIKMQTAMKELEDSWVREWRVLFMADYAEDSNLVTKLLQKLNRIIRAYPKHKEITTRQKWLLKKVTLGASYLTKVEIAKAVKYVLLNHIDLGKKILVFLIENLEDIKKLENLKRKNVVLIIDENLDHIPFETIKILRNQPITRMPCLSIAYTLFKEYENSMEDGCKVIEVTDNLGTFIVNPAGDLAGSEKRLKVFNDYWLENWKGVYGTPPNTEMFEKALVDYDILMYNGHGSGMEYLSGEQIEKIRVKANTLLFGCGSASLKPIGGRYSPIGISNQYLMGYSPCILGMLWAVTDTEIDLVTVHFLSQWLKSNANLPWSNFDQNHWAKGKLVFKEAVDKAMKSFEPEMLRAIASSRWVCEQYMTSASVVVRGLPIKLKYK